MLRWGLKGLFLLVVIGVSCRSTPEIEEDVPVYSETVVDTTQSDSARLSALFADYDEQLTRPPAFDSAAAVTWVDSTLAGLSLEEKIGQMIMVELPSGGLRGLFGDADNLAESHAIGGFLVPRLMPPSEVFRRTSALQQVARVPLLFAADYERGVGRFTNPLTELPSNMAVGATRDEIFAAAMGRLTAIESRAIGVNLIFAPVVDVNDNPHNPIINIRSFGEDPGLVGRMAAAFVREAQQFGTQTTLKHFPGHGNTAVDTHARMAVVSGDRADLDSTELHPYSFVFSQDVRPAAVMSAHLWAEGIDDEALPATFSSRALTEVLRGDLGFEGFIVTDDVKMGALRGRYSFAERVLNPIRAGADMILTPEDPVRAIAVIREAVEAGDLAESTVDEAVRRVLWAKARALLYRNDSPHDALLDYLLEDSRGAAIAQAIADEAVTVLRTADRLPLTAETRPLLLQMTNYRGSESIAAAMDLLEGMHDGLAGSHRFEEDVSSARADEVVSAAGESDVVIVALYLRLIAGRGDAALDAGQARLVSRLVAADTPVVLITFGNPYAVTAFADADAHIVAYDQSLETVRAVHRVLTGDLAPSGRLPISVDPYPFGAGLDSL
ncbi:MAG TPA: glycoside hydrolase family 3 protein [Rhodothermales bacterium]